jgi:hypothetical protein
MFSRVAVAAVILAAALQAHGAVVIKSLQPVREIPFSLTDSVVFERLAYARDAAFDYLGTPEGLHRVPRLASSAPLERIAFPGEMINAIAFDDSGAMYVAKGYSWYAVWQEHTLMRSRDGGATFTPVDAGLHDCVVETECGYLVPEEISFAPGRMFVSAGGNVLVTADEGANYKVLVGATSDGKPAAQTCPVTFERVGQRLIYGGECPLDFGYVRAGSLRGDFLEWQSLPETITPPQMQNRNVQFIEELSGGAIYAGIEGALMKSTDGGRTFDYVIYYPLSAPDRYPYISEIVESSRHPGLLLAGGFDKKNQVAYLAYSPDNGASWNDISGLVADASNVGLLAEDADGRLLVGTFVRDRFVISEVQLSETQGKRRSARR